MSFIDGFIIGMKDKKITQDSCKQWACLNGQYNNELVDIFNYYDPLGKNIVAQKVKDVNGNTVKINGNLDNAGLYGQWLFAGNGKKVIIVRDELDAISLSQINNHKYPVVGLNVFASGKKYLQRNLEWLQSFEEIVIMLGNTQEAKKLTEDCATLFTPGKVKIAKLPAGSVNAMLREDKQSDIIDCIYKAKEYRPDGIVNGKETLDLIKAQLTEGVEIHYPELNKKTLGLRKGEMWVITAGSGIGKSTIFKEIAYNLLMQGKTIGYIGLEESVKRTAESFVGIHLNKPIHLSKEGIDDEEIEKAWSETLGTGRVFLYDHFGSLDAENLLSKIRYLSKGCGCDYIFLDHISIVVSGISEGDERRIIDNVMTKLRSLVEETKIWLGVISHLKRPEGGKGHEDGAQTHLAQLRGSGSIAQLADMVIGVERNQQDEDEQNISNIRVLKNRYTGMTGLADSLKYNIQTGRLTVHESKYEDIFGKN